MKRIKAQDRVGKKFNRLTIIGYEMRDCNGCNQAYAICKCDCGNVHTTRMAQVVRGDTKSCGCLRQEVAVENAKIRWRYPTRSKKV